MSLSYADLYAECLVEQDSAKFAARNAAITDFLEKADTDDLLDTVRMLFGHPPLKPTFESEFNAFFSNKDSGFKTLNNELERKALAGIALLRFVEDTSSSDSNIISLATLCAGLRGQNPNSPRGSVIVEFDTRLLNASRERATARTGVPLDEIKVNGDKIRSKVKEIGDSPDPQKFREAIDLMVKHLFSYSERFSTKADLLAEELNMVWWVLSSHTRANTPKTKVTQFEAPILFGKELADLTVVSVGPASAHVLLQKALENHGADSEISIKQAVSSIDTVLKQELAKVSTKVDNVFVPVLAAISKSAEAGQNDWTIPYKNVTGLSADFQMKSVDLAFQVYREILLTRCFNDRKK